MIKLKSLLKESDSQKLPSPKLKEYLLSKRTVTFSGTLYHGCPFVGLKSILINQIHGVQHGELSEYDTFSTSVNPRVLQMFSDGDGKTGLKFKVKNVNILILNDMLGHFATFEQGSGMEFDYDEKKAETFAKVFELPKDRFDGVRCFPWDYLSSLGVDAVTYEYTWKKINSGHSKWNNDESEICFLGKGIDTLNSSISSIIVDGEVCYNKEEALNILSEIDFYEDD